MTKKELIQKATELNIEISDPKHTTKDQINQMIAEAEAHKASKIYTKTKSRNIKPTVMAWFDNLGTPEAVDNTSFEEFMQRVLEACPFWAKQDDLLIAKKHFSWYKSFWKKQYDKNHAEELVIA